MKKINLKLRFKNKVVLAALLTAALSFIYDVLNILGITPAIPEGQVMEYIEMVLTLLVIMGVITDPTTSGLKDSGQAMSYKEPRK